MPNPSQETTTITTTQNITICDNNQPINNNLEKTINLNEFLDFLNISCHVNDMISQNNIDLQKPQKTSLGIAQKCEQTSLAKFCVQPQTRQSHSTSFIDFNKLTQNSLLRKFYSKGDQNSCVETAQDCTQNSARSSVIDNNGRLYPWYIKRNDHNSIWCTTKKSISASATEADIATKTLKNKTELREKLNDKLDEILKEGVLDSVLPFICPVPFPANYANRLKSKKQVLQQQDKTNECVEKLTATILSNTGNNSNIMTIPITANCQQIDDKCDSTPSSVTLSKTSRSKQMSSRRKSKSTPLEQTIHPIAPVKKSMDIVIHVCDEVKNTTKDFTCPQDLLISKMGYFADVSQKQKLDETDISVHCDIKIFEWLMKWLKFNADINIQSNEEKPPNLGYSNVIPILVSASFLKMEPLILECLSFCHGYLSDVVRYSPNLSCLNNAIITRMAAMFTNVELEMVEDKRDRLTPRLWTKLIQSLCEIEPETLRGHFSTTAGLFKCLRCHQYITNTMKSYIMCVPSNIRLNRWGQVVSRHTRDPNWDINAYIIQLFKELNSWRLVYWKLWGHVHYLYCCLCESHFPVYQMHWCRFHTDTPTYLGPMIDGRMTGPAGRYPCCGQQVFRYETLPTPSGCRFRDHSVLVETDQERSILSICQLAIDNMALDEAPLCVPHDKTTKSDSSSQLSCISLLPQRSRQSLLPSIDGSNDIISRLLQRSKFYEKKFFFDSTTETDTSIDSTSSQKHKKKKRSQRKKNLRRSHSTCSTCSSDGSGRGGGSSSGGGEGSTAFNKKKRHLWSYHKKQVKQQKNTENLGRHWSGDLSARSNQDHQREYEEKIMKQILNVAHKKSAIVVRSNDGVRKPRGGTYVRLEQEWRDEMKNRYSTNLVNNSNNSSVNLGFSGIGSGSTTITTSGSTASVYTKLTM